MSKEIWLVVGSKEILEAVNELPLANDLNGNAKNEINAIQAKMNSGSFLSIFDYS